MDEITPIRVFLEVARRQSFTGTAEHFGLSISAISKHVATLEKSLNARLLNRTTKTMSLTRAGSLVVERGTAVVRDLANMRASVAGLNGDISGVVRVGAAPYFGAQRITPLIASFCEQHPAIQVTLTLLSHRRVGDFVKEGLDVGIINSPDLQDATHSAYTITNMPQVLVASPSYQKRAGRIQTPSDLAKLNCLVNSYKSPTGTWRFNGPQGEVTVTVQGNFRSIYGDCLKVAAVHGMGISMHPRYMVAKELAQGELVQLLPDFEPEMLHVFALFASGGLIPQSVRTFLDFLRQWGRENPNWID